MRFQRRHLRRERWAEWGRKSPWGDSILERGEKIYKHLLRHERIVRLHIFYYRGRNIFLGFLGLSAYHNGAFGGLEQTVDPFEGLLVHHFSDILGQTGRVPCRFRVERRVPVSQ